MKEEAVEEQARKVLESGYKAAEETLGDEKKTRNLFENLDKKLKKAKLLGVLESIPLLVDLLKSYIKGEYKEIPVGSIIAVVSALIYWVSPIDIIPDFIPGVGYLDDAAVVMICLTLVKTDLDTYKEWAEAHKSEEESE